MVGNRVWLGITERTDKGARHVLHRYTLHRMANLGGVHCGVIVGPTRFHLSKCEREPSATHRKDLETYSKEAIGKPLPLRTGEPCSKARRKTSLSAVAEEARADQYGRLITDPELTKVFVLCAFFLRSSAFVPAHSD